MMASRFGIRKVVVAALCAVLSLVAIGGYWFFVRNHEDRAVGTPTCRIELLSRDERVRRESMHTPPKLPEPPKSPFGEALSPPATPLWRAPPATQADNPLLYNSNYAVVRFENPTGQALSVYAIRGRGDKWPIIRDAFIVDVEVRDPAGTQVVSVIRSLQCCPNPLVYPVVPSVEELRQNPPPTFMIQPGEGVELPIPILDDLPAVLTLPLQAAGIPAQPIKPGVYTVRATVSYAEAPSGEKREVVSEPVKVTVTAEHVKAAEAFWKTEKK